MDKKVLGHTTAKPHKNVHTAISVDKPKLSVTKHDQTLTGAHIYNTSRYTANTKMYSRILHTHSHTHTQVGVGGGGWGVEGLLIIYRYEETSF